MKNIHPLHLIVGGLGLAIISVFLPWVSYTSKLPAELVALAGTSGSHSASGTRSNLGILALLLMAGVIASCFIKVPGKAKLISTSALAAAGLAALLILIEFIRTLSDSTSNELVSISVGIGLYLCVLGAAAGTFGSFLRWRNTPADPPAAPLLPPHQ
ncbi:MAG TPA: hypothetical protein VG796_06965 [Verrucomicrobiales bacterium]|nr:hypothetical protein [Verrucomicrobiales bacterium]